ncbi:carbohydrate binding domain-containing protein [Gorillibacterium sp. sgz500922]|uniref:carbohydrate binding domain-containing protein n=1 Tax=Gorillibacterium sp. sgz500922 TaxID=3446694 RepID=UPI003F66E708
MKRFLTSGLIVCIMAGSFTTAGYASSKTEGRGETVQKHWAETALRKWTASGVLAGYPDGSLKPDQPISRAELSSLLQRVFGVGGAGTGAFTDVPAKAWYAGAVAAVLRAGYIAGYPDGTFRPDQPVTRADTAVMLSRAFHLPETGSGKKDTEESKTFSDKSAIRPYALPAVTELVEAGALEGYPDGSFRPGQTVTRGEAVVLLDRLAGTLYNKAVTEERKETLANAVINASGVTLRNKEVTGNLYLAQGIGLGDAAVDSSSVAGTVFINGGGSNSIHLNDSTMAEAILEQPDHPIRVVANGHTALTRLALRSPAAIQLAQGAVIQLLTFQSGSDGSTIGGTGKAVRVRAEASGIRVNGMTLESGKDYVWSADRAALIPAGNTTSPSAGAGGPTPGPAVWSPVLAPGSLPGTTKATAPMSAGSRLAVQISSQPLSVPKAGDPLPKSSLLLDPYEPGTDISGVDPAVNKYLGIYEVDGNGKVARFQQLTVTPGTMKPEAWNLVWKDDFDGAGIDSSKWNFVQGGGGFGNHELQTYTDRAENARVEDGKLVIEARKEPAAEGNAYTSAKLTTEGKGDWTYGKYEVRAKLPEGQGIWPAIWMMPKDQNLYSGWPTCGEIDIMELLGQEPNKIYGTLHYGQPHEQAQGSYSLPGGATFSDDYHTFGLEWEPGEFRFYVDGLLYAKLNNWYSQNPQEGAAYTYPAPFDQDFFLQLNLAVGGDWPGNPNGTTAFPQKMLVDYVRVYEREGQAYREPTLPAKQSSAIREPAADGNYVLNGEFAEDLSRWTFQPFAPPADLYGGTGSAAWDQGAVRTTIEKEGDVNYAIQLVQAGLPLLKGSTYQLSFDAWSTDARSMVASLSGPDRNYVRYMDDRTVALSGERQTYTYTFTMKADTDPNARLEFNMGKAGTLPVWIDGVRLIKTADPDPNAPREALPSGNLIYNGTFDQGKDRLGFWKLEGAAAAQAEVRVGSAVGDRKLYGKPASAGEPYSLIVSQDRLNLLAGKTYVLSFTARAEENVSLAARIGNQAQSGLDAEQTFEIGTEPRSYSMIVAPIPEKHTGKLEFGLGALTGRLELDHVTLKEMSPPVTVQGTKRIEAENYSDMSGVQKGEDGKSVGWIDPGDWMQYILDVRQAGEYKIAYYVASGYEGGGSLTLLAKQGSVYTHTLPVGEIREEDADFRYTMEVANTGDWGSFKLVEQTVQLNAGIQTLQIYAPHVNVDYFILTNGLSGGSVGNLVRNGTFDADVSEWQTYEANKLSISAEQGDMRIVLPLLTADSWNQQVYQEGITLEEGKTYSVTFEASSTVDRPIQLSVGNIDPDANYAYTDFLDGHKPTLWLTSEKKLQQFTFVMKHPTETNAKLEFDLGQMTVGGVVYNAPGEIRLDNIRLSGSLIENGLFEENADHWSAYWGDEWNGSSAGRLTTDSGAMVIKIDRTGSQNWNPQISQEGIRLEEGKTYRFSFDARAEAPRKMNIGFGKKLSEDPWYIGYFGADVELSAESKTYSFTFTMKAATEDNARLDFNVGAFDGSDADLADVRLDNIVLVEVGEP